MYCCHPAVFRMYFIKSGWTEPQQWHIVLAKTTYKGLIFWFMCLSLCVPLMDAQECPKCTLNTQSFINAVDECSSFRLANDSLALTALLQWWTYTKGMVGQGWGSSPCSGASVVFSGWEIDVVPFWSITLKFLYREKFRVEFIRKFVG